MYRIGLFCLLLIQAQIGLSQQPADTTRDFGWMIDKDDGALVYIVQVAPSQATQMQLNRLENLSDIPPELVGRATRISVRIGTDQLPRTPSLAEIQKMPRYGTASDVTAALGPGRISDLEPGSVVNVQGPTLPNSAPRSGPTLPSQDFATSNSSGSTLPSSNSGSGINPPTLPRVGFDPSASSTGSGTSNVSPQFGQRGDGASASQVRTPTLPNNQASSQSGQASSAGMGSLDSRAGNGRGFAGGWMSDQRPGNSNAYPQNANPSNDMSTRANTDTTAQSGSIRTPVPNFGSTPGAHTNDAFGQPSSAAGTLQPPSGYAADPYQRGGSSSQSGFAGRQRDPSQGTEQRLPASRIAGPPGFSSSPDGFRPEGSPPPAGYPPNNGNWAPNPQNPSGYDSGPLTASRGASGKTLPAGDSAASASDRNASATTGQTVGSQNADSGQANNGSVASAGNVLIQMFFLVSLVANVYLVFLIRKLLNRYRSLLSTVRSQTA